MKTSRILILTLLAMIAFASNSLLCRFALRQTEIDAASFTAIRLFSGAIMLALLAATRRQSLCGGGDWFAAFALFAYAAGFSFAYRTLPAGTGALLLFGTVQATMIFWGLGKGERLHFVQLFGFTLALLGLVVLVFPGLSAPPLGGSVLMITAGLAWGLYSIRGKGAGDPIAATTGNFIRALPFAALLQLAFLPWLRGDRAGAIYAIVSGAITSGLGYILWYLILPQIRATSAATIQLCVPVIAAAGGILLLGEPLSLRFLIAGVAVLGGIALVISARRPVT